MREYVRGASKGRNLRKSLRVVRIVSGIRICNATHKKKKNRLKTAQKKNGGVCVSIPARCRRELNGITRECVYRTRQDNENDKGTKYYCLLPAIIAVR